MKKIFITILLAALMPFAAGAQDARQRTAETIVADALAQLPAQTPKAFDSLMQELAATGADGIRMMAAMLVPAAEGKNRNRSAAYPRFSRHGNQCFGCYQ